MPGAECPKHMRFGPCGGPHNGDLCELGDRRCPFVAGGDDLAGLSDATTHQPTPVELGATVLVDVRAPSSWRGDIHRLWAETAQVLHGCAALLGEHVDNAPLSDDAGAADPASVIALMHAHGVRTIATLTGRDRDLSMAASAIDALTAPGLAAIHCVTGDHPAALGLQRSAWFGCESITLAGLVSSRTIGVTVAESPASPGQRARRVLAKERAGASVCVLNSSGDADVLVEFVDRCRDVGVTLEFVAPVPMVASRNAALALAAFPGVKMPTGMLDAVARSSDPLAEGIAWSTALADRLRASDRFIGCNLSGGARGADPWERLAATNGFVDAVLAVWS